MSIAIPPTQPQHTLAWSNLSMLAANSYPGRGLVVGLSEEGNDVYQLYWLMGRSQNSRERVLKADDSNRVFTDKLREDQKVENSELVLYNAMRETVYKEDGLYRAAISNGRQTDKIIELLESGHAFSDIMRGFQYEPDTNATCRISAVVRIFDAKPSVEISLLRKSPFSGACDRMLFQYDEFLPGLGFGITTYTGDDDPLPPYNGEPTLLPLKGDLEEVAKTYWGSLNQRNRVALAVKKTNLFSHGSTLQTINQYKAS